MTKPLRVGVDARTLNRTHIRGTGRYIFEILRNVKPEDQIEFTAYGNDPSQAMRIPEGTCKDVDVFEFRGHRFEAWEQLGLPLRLRKSRPDLLHCADNHAPVWQPTPTVVTIHDTVPWADPAPSLLYHHYLHHVQSVALRRCRAVITISKASQRDIVARWPFLAPRLHVIPHGISDEFFQDQRDHFPAALHTALGNHPYLLYLGGPQPKKRFGWAVELLARSGRPDLHLVAVGFAAGTADPRHIPPDLAGRVHIAPFVNESELVALYQRASGAIYPTLYEGFGFPAVEAQAAGTPILFSPVSSLEELVGPLTWSIPPHDFSQWQAALDEVLSLPPPAKANKVEQARQWVQRFSWRESAKTHVALYRDVSTTVR